MDGADADGFAHPDTYSALIELASPVARDAGEGVAALSALRARVRAAGGTRHRRRHPSRRRLRRRRARRRAALSTASSSSCRASSSARRPARCTSTSGCPTPRPPSASSTGCASSCRCCRRWPPTRPSGTAATRAWPRARAQLFRGYPSADIPRAFDSFDDYAESVAGVVAAGDLPDYTFLWWDIRPHPRLGTVEVRAMDSQSALWSAAGLAALVHGLARAEAQERPRRLDPARGAHGGVVHRRARRAARAAADGRRAAPGARGRPRRARARAPARRGARLGRRAGGHRADPRRGQRRRPPARRPRPRRDGGAARPARGRGRGSPTDRRRRCRRP